jgi:cold shock CspA family protein
MSATEKGVVKWFGEKGYGFIRTSAGIDLFAHVTELATDIWPVTGDTVEFSRGTDRSGREIARRIKILSPVK